MACGLHGRFFTLAKGDKEITLLNFHTWIFFTYGPKTTLNTNTNLAFFTQVQGTTLHNDIQHKGLIRDTHPK